MVFRLARLHEYVVLNLRNVFFFTHSNVTNVPIYIVVSDDRPEQ